MKKPIEVEYGFVDGYYYFVCYGLPYKIIMETTCCRLIVNGNRTSITRVHLKSMINFLEKKFNIKLVRD